MKYNEVSWTSCPRNTRQCCRKQTILNHFLFVHPPSHSSFYLPVPLWHVFYNCLKSTFVHLCAIIDWIEIIFSSEGFNKESSAGTKSERAPRLFGGPNYREKLFCFRSLYSSTLTALIYCLLSLFGVYLEYLDIILSCTLCISHKEVYFDILVCLTTLNLNYYYNLFFSLLYALPFSFHAIYQSYRCHMQLMTPIT